MEWLTLRMPLFRETFVPNERGVCSIGDTGLFLQGRSIFGCCSYRRSGVLLRVRHSTLLLEEWIVTSMTSQMIDPTWGSACRQSVRWETYHAIPDAGPDCLCSI